MTFKERFFLGEIPFEDIDRYTSRWNFSDETCTLAAYLGLNGEEEDVWISQSDEALEALLEKEKAAYLACPTKILFTDLDGTLLNNNKEISPANREATSGPGSRTISSSSPQGGPWLPFCRWLRTSSWMAPAAISSASTAPLCMTAGNSVFS